MVCIQVRRRRAQCRSSNLVPPRPRFSALSPAFALIALFSVTQIACAADTPATELRQGIGWVSKRGVAVCIDPGGYFISNVGHDPGQESLTVNVPGPSGIRGLAVTSSTADRFGVLSLSIFHVEASDLSPLTVAAALPNLPADVTVAG